MEAIPEDDEEQRRSIRAMKFKNLTPAPTASTVGPTKLIGGNTNEPDMVNASAVNFESGDANRKDNSVLKGGSTSWLQSPSKLKHVISRSEYGQVVRLPTMN